MPSLFSSCPARPCTELREEIDQFATNASELRDPRAARGGEQTTTMAELLGVRRSPASPATSLHHCTARIRPLFRLLARLDAALRRRCRSCCAEPRPVGWCSPHTCFSGAPAAAAAMRRRRAMCSMQRVYVDLGRSGAVGAAEARLCVGGDPPTPPTQLGRGGGQPPRVVDDPPVRLRLALVPLRPPLLGPCCDDWRPAPALLCRVRRAQGSRCTCCAVPVPTVASAAGAATSAASRPPPRPPQGRGRRPPCRTCPIWHVFGSKFISQVRMCFLIHTHMCITSGCEWFGAPEIRHLLP